MSISKNLTSRHNLGKQAPKPSYLDNAIQNLSNLLDQNPLDFNEIPEKSTTPMDLKDEEIDNYLMKLTERLFKIQENLTKEESHLFKAQEENIELKAKWSEEVRKQENTVKLGKSEIIKLSDQNKELLNDMHSQIKEKEFLLKEIEKINIETEKNQSEIEKINKFHTSFDKKDEKELMDELKELRGLIKNQEDLKELQERNLKLIKKEINSITMKNENSEKKSHQIKEKITKLEREKNCGDDKNSKFMADYKASINKKNKLNKKLEELEMIDKKFEEEIILKNQQMELGRKKNQNLEIKKIKFDTLESQISLEKEITSTLHLEKEMLLEHLEELLSDGKINPISNEINNSQKKLSLSCSADNFIEELKKSNHNTLNLYDKFIELPLEKCEEYHKILDENIKMEDKLQELEIKIAEKKGVIDDIDKENNEHKFEAKQILNRMEENKLQKSNLLEKYSLLEKEIKI